MKKRKTKNHIRISHHTSNIVSIIICIIAIGLLIATCLNSYYANKQQAKNIQDINRIIVQLSSEDPYSNESALEDIYLSYYSSIDQKATDSISIAISFFGFIFSLVTIVNTVISVTLPKQFENSLIEIESRVKEVERSAQESTNAARYVDSISSKKTTREKINAITSIIDTYGDNAGEFFFSRGFLYDDIKDYDNAKADYLRAKKAGGAEHVFHNSMGVLYSNLMVATTTRKEKQKDFHKAEQHFKKAIMLLESADKESDYCHCNLACLYQDYAKTLKGWSIIEGPNSKTKLASEYWQEFQKYSKLALDEFNHTIKISDDFLTAFYNRGISYREMGEEYHQKAYEDFQRCYEIDPENKDVWGLLFKTAVALYQKTNNKEYYDTAKVCIKRLREDFDQIDLFNKKFLALETPVETESTYDPNKRIAQIDEKIADLSLEEAEENIEDPAKYGNLVSDALESYNSSLEMYRRLYAQNGNKEYWEAIERINGKISRIQNPNQQPVQ